MQKILTFPNRKSSVFVIFKIKILTNDVVNFEQLAPGFLVLKTMYCQRIENYKVIVLVRSRDCSLCCLSYFKLTRLNKVNGYFNI